MLNLNLNLALLKIKPLNSKYICFTLMCYLKYSSKERFLLACPLCSKLPKKVDGDFEEGI